MGDMVVNPDSQPIPSISRSGRGLLLALGKAVRYYYKNFRDLLSISDIIEPFSEYMTYPGHYKPGNTGNCTQSYSWYFW